MAWRAEGRRKTCSTEVAEVKTVCLCCVEVGQGRLADTVPAGTTDGVQAAVGLQIVLLGHAWQQPPSQFLFRRLLVGEFSLYELSAQAQQELLGCREQTRAERLE